jgi:hypothetical protein
MSGMDVLWDSDPDTVSGKSANPAAPSNKMTFSHNSTERDTSTDAGTSTLRQSAAIVIGSLGLLWLLGGVVFKDVRL